MAVAGLHNVSAISSSLGIEAQSSLPRWCANNEKQSTSLLRMWRELEGDQIASSSQSQVGGRSMQENVIEHGSSLSNTCLSAGSGDGSVHSLIDSNEKENERIISPRVRQIEHDDTRSSSSESTNYSEVERERLREVFREWQNNGLRNNTPSDSNSNNSTRAQWLGEKECERVRTVREWVNKTTHQRDRCHGGGRDGQDSETGVQIDRVHEGHSGDQCETRPKRTIRRLCGRQTLLDLLMRAEKERRRELQDLLDHKHVSDFPYRNRIQSLLKGRFLRNTPYNQDEKHSSLAASELGILRQKQTVSGLREGFLSPKLENCISGPVGSCQSDSSSHSDISCHRNEQTRVNSFHDVVQDEFCHSEPDSEETDTNISKTEDLEFDASEGSHLQESEALAGESRDGLVLESENREQQSSTDEFDARRTFVSESSWRSTDDRQHDTLGTERSEQGTLLEPCLSVSQGYDPTSNERDAPSASGDIDQLEATVIEGMSWQNIPLELEDWQDSVIEDGDIDWVQLSMGNYTAWREASEDGIDTISHASSHQEEYELRNDSEHFHFQVPQDEWHENASNDGRDDWSDRPSVEEVPGVDVSHFSDDDNGQSLELRQLHSRRRVSNLLRSDFRASLDRLIQSYVERRDHAPLGWEADGASSSPPAVIEEQEEQMTVQSEVFVSTSLPTVVLPSPQVTSSQTTWEHNAGQQQVNSIQQSRIDWEIVNDLRLDMAMLNHRMNSMQMMLEACMDMQLELQRSVRQEVSAALNWQSRSADSEVNLVPDESNLEHVKNGVCCICCDANIDSLLYRCGHMCACSKCAQKLVEGKDKCPMCRAPVVEVIRAYSIQ
ncbi:hypothetical protein ACET3Z_013889 [Daucus carota]